MTKTHDQELEAVVLVGGEGTRLRPFTERTPKAMLPLLRRRPLLAYTFDDLRRGGVERAILSCGYLPEEIEEYFGDEFEGLQLEYRSEPERRGTGGGIRFAASGLERAFVALNGDSLREARLEPLLLRDALVPAGLHVSSAIISAEAMVASA